MRSLQRYGTKPASAALYAVLAVVFCVAVLCYGCTANGDGEGNKNPDESGEQQDVQPEPEPEPEPADPLDAARKVISLIKPETYYYVQSATTGKVLEAEGDDVPAGAAIHFRDKAETTNQFFTLWLCDDGSYIIRNYATSSVILTLTEDGLLVDRDEALATQRWYIEPAEDGCVKITCAGDESYVLFSDSEGAASADETGGAGETGETGETGEQGSSESESSTPGTTEALCRLQSIMDMANASVLVEGLTKNYTGEELSPVIEVYFFKQHLVVGVDYVVLYDGSAQKPVNPGQYVVSIEGITPAFGAKTVGTFTIVNSAELPLHQTYELALPVVGTTSTKALSVIPSLKTEGFYSLLNAGADGTILSVPSEGSVSSDECFVDVAERAKQNPARTITAQSTIVCIGDSVLNGYTPTGSCAAWGTILASYFQAKALEYGEGGLGFASTGQLGNSVIDYLDTIWDEHGEDPDIFIIGLGMNDTRSYKDYDQVYYAVTVILDVISEYWPGAEVYIFPNIWYDKDFENYYRGEEITQAVVDAVNDYYWYNPDVYVTTGCETWLLGNHEVISLDGVHPFVEGQTIIAERMLAAILSRNTVDWVYVPNTDGYTIRCAYDTNLALAYTQEGELTLVRVEC